MTIRPIASLIALSLLLAGLSSAAAPEAAAPAPSFRAGAEVALGLTVYAPEMWVINPGVPFRVTFDQEALKAAPFKIDKAVQDFKLKNYVGEIYVELPVKLNKDVTEGELSIPLKIECGICTADQESCTTTSGEATVKLQVRNEPAPGSKTSALKKGVIPAEYYLPLPY